MNVRLLTFLSLLFTIETYSASKTVLDVMEKCKKGGISNQDLLYLIKNDKNFDINARDDANLTLLMWCSSTGRNDTVNVLLENGAYVDADTKGQTALHAAAKFGKEAIVWRLLKAGANKNRKDDSGFTPADYANRAGYYQIVEMLGGKPLNLFIDQKRKEAYAILDKAEKGEISPSEFSRMFAFYGPLIDEPFWEGTMNILQRSVGNDDIELLNAVINLKPDLNAIDHPEGNSALHYASVLQNFAAVKRLLEAGADPNIKNSDGATPEQMAGQSLEKMKTLVFDFKNRKIKKDKNTQQMIISYLKSYKNPSKWKAKIKEHETQIDQINRQLMEEAAAKAKAATPSKPNIVGGPKVPFAKLMDTAGKSIEVGNLAGLTWALDNGLPPDARFQNGNPIILQICFYGNIPMLQALVSRGANINIRGVDGVTPLMAAVKGYKYDVVAYLVKIGADKTLKNNYDWSALDFARQNRDDRLMFLTKF